MRNTNMRVFQRSHFTLIDMHTVGGDGFGFEYSLFLYIRNNRHSHFFAHVLHFLCGFRDMDMQRNIVFQCKVFGSLQDLITGGVGGMWGNGRRDQSMPFPFLNETGALFHGFFVRMGIRCWIFHYRLREHTAQTDLCGGFGDHILKVVHVQETGYT